MEVPDMNEATFQSELRRCETMRRFVTEPTEADFYVGYMRGLRRRYHGEKFGTEEEHQLWLTLAESDDASHAAEGRGYLAALDASYDDQAEDFSGLENQA